MSKHGAVFVGDPPEVKRMCLTCDMPDPYCNGNCYKIRVRHEGKKPRVSLDEQTILRLDTEGKSPSEMAKILGTTDIAIRQWFRRKGLRWSTWKG